MNKSLLTLLLIALSSITCLGQLPDSVKIDNEWRYVYPVQEGIDFEDEYYAYFGLQQEEFPIWVEWKIANDPRVNLKPKKLRAAIYVERFKRKEVRDSIPFLLKLGSYYGLGGTIDKEKYTSKSKFLYYLSYDELDEVPPLVQSLPSGKYVQFFEPYATVEKGSKRKIITTDIACEFELDNNELTNSFLRFRPNSKGDTIVKGNYDKGFKVGIWTELHDYVDNYNVSVSNYVLGVQEGKASGYFNDELCEIRNYKNGKLSGQVIEVHENDSTVYDAFEIFDRFVDYYSLYRLQYEVSINKLKILAKKSLPNSWILNCMRPTIAEKLFYKIPNQKVYTDSTELDKLERKFHVMNNDFVAHFQTYYKKFDRKSGRLIFERYLDTVTRKFSGASWFDNRKQFDTIWTKGDNSGIEQIIYDLNGKVIYSTLVKQEVIKSINGFKAKAVFSSGTKLNRYTLSEKTQHNDTVFHRMEWDKNEKLVEAHFSLVGDQMRQRILFFEGGYFLYQRGSDFENSKYVSGDLTLSIHKDKVDKLILGIQLKDKDYSGLMEYVDLSEPMFHNWRVKLSGNDKIYEFREIEKTNHGPVTDFMNDFQRKLLTFYDSDLYITSFKGEIKNNYLNGKVIIKGIRNPDFELDYRNGLPNGRVEIYHRVSKFYQKNYFIKYLESDSDRSFSSRGLKRNHLGQSYEFKNGLLDGYAITYLSNGDTLGFIPFKEGLREGKAFRYNKNETIKAEFHKDNLTGHFIVRNKSLLKSTYDTTYFAEFDNTGKFTRGFEQDIDKLFGNKIKQISYEGDRNGNLSYVLVDTNGLAEKGILHGFDYLSQDWYKNNLIKTSITHTYREKPVTASHLVSMIYGYNLGDLRLENPIESANGSRFLRRQITSESSLFSHYFKKYFPNGIIQREGNYGLTDTDNYRGYKLYKSGVWKVNNYEGHKLYELNYFDSIIKIGGQEWKIVGEQTNFDTLGNEVSSSYVLFEEETYECSNDEYYTEKQFINGSSKDPLRMNGWTRNYFDNRSLMNEGKVENGIPVGLWKFFTPDGKLHKLGNYMLGKENGKWLIGDLGEKAYIGEVCIDPDDPYYEFNVHSLENDKEIEVIIYKKGVVLKRTNYGGNGGDSEIRSDIQLR